MTSTCCRLCLANSDDLESIFSIKNGSLLMDLIKIICPIPIETVEDDLPQSICQECVEIVTSAHQIRVMSVQSDFKLRSMRYHDPLVKSEVVIEKSVFVEASDDWDNDDSMHHSEYEPDLFEPTVGNKSEMGRLNKRLTKRLKCDRCQFRTSYKNTMAVHSRSHLTDDAASETQFQCNFCENVYSNRTDRYRHIRFEHQGMSKHAANESLSRSLSNVLPEVPAASSSLFRARVLPNDNRQTSNIRPSHTTAKESNSDAEGDFDIESAWVKAVKTTEKRNKYKEYFEIIETFKPATSRHEQYRFACNNCGKTLIGSFLATTHFRKHLKCCWKLELADFDGLKSTSIKADNRISTEQKVHFNIS